MELMIQLFYRKGDCHILLEGKRLSVPAPLCDVLIDGLTVYVRVDPNLIERNIFAYNYDGTLKWQIQPPSGTNRGKGFIFIQQTSKGPVVSANGLNYDFNKETGEVFLDPDEDLRL